MKRYFLVFATCVYKDRHISMLESHTVALSYLNRKVFEDEIKDKYKDIDYINITNIIELSEVDFKDYTLNHENNPRTSVF